MSDNTTYTIIPGGTNPRKDRESPITTTQLQQILEMNSKIVEINIEVGNKYAEIAETLEENSTDLVALMSNQKTHDKEVKEMLASLEKSIFHLKVIFSSTIATAIIAIIMQLLLK